MFFSKKVCNTLNYQEALAYLYSLSGFELTASGARNPEENLKRESRPILRANQQACQAGTSLPDCAHRALRGPLLFRARAAAAHRP